MVSNLVGLVKFAIEKYPNEVECYSMLKGLFEMARQNDHRAATVGVYCPDDWIKNIKGKDKLRDVYVIMKIDRMVLDRANSLIVMPEEVAE